MSPVSEYKIASIILERKFEEKELKVSAILQVYGRVIRKLQNLKTGSEMSKISVEDMIWKRMSERGVRLKTSGRILSIVDPQYASFTKQLFFWSILD